MTVLRRVIDHIKNGNKAQIISIGEGIAVRYAILPENVEVLITDLDKYYSKK